MYVRIILAGITLWFLTSAFLVFVIGTILWLLKKFSLLCKVEEANWARLTAFSLLLPPSSGIPLAVAGLTSAILCPATTIRHYHLCVHSARHLCSHRAATNVLQSQFVMWGALTWCGLVATTLTLLMSRRKYIKRIEPSPKLRQAIAQSNLPSNLPVWETDCDIPAGLIGVISPSIFVSQELIQRLPVEALAVVLNHEYAHLARRDHWLRFWVFATALIFAPVPFVVWLQKEWRDASEKAADNFAASDERAASLLSQAFEVIQGVWVPKSAEQLKRRVEMVKNRESLNTSESLFGAVAVVCGLAFCAFIVLSPSIWLTLHCFAEALILR